MTQSDASPKQKTNWRFLIALFAVLISLYLLGSWVKYAIEKQQYDEQMVIVHTQNAKENDELGKKLDAYTTPIIKAIDQYKNDKGKYPESLDALVPEYLTNKPYIAFGEKLQYDPTPGQFGQPFYFGFAGSDSILSLNGWDYAYCPASVCNIDSYTGLYRINENWIYIHGSW